MKKIKTRLKKIKIIYIVVSFIFRLFNAVKKIKIDFSSIREFIIGCNGGQTLGSENYRFYSNLVTVLNSHGSKKHFHFIDIGANDGWFAKTIMRFFSDARITSFEPLKSQQSFLETLSLKNPNFKYNCVAAGDFNGECEITEYKTTGLSTLRKIDESYEYPVKHYSQEVINTYIVPVVKLDDVMFNSINGDEITILKIDTQGFELETLKGAVGLLKYHMIQYIIIELMTVRKYSEAALYNEILDFLHDYGFKLYDINPSYYEQNTGKLSEFDALFKLEI
ncbi:MAG: FkbM family methyltransferase [Bacteroidetes bacterium]|nr:FkbM family methyltransferase [Bacteroidota bacterium]